MMHFKITSSSARTTRTSAIAATVSLPKTLETSCIAVYSMNVVRASDGGRLTEFSRVRSLAFFRLVTMSDERGRLSAAERPRARARPRTAGGPALSASRKGLPGPAAVLSAFAISVFPFSLSLSLSLSR